MINVLDLQKTAGVSGDDTLNFVRLSVAMMRQDPDLVKEVTIEPLESNFVEYLMNKIMPRACYHNVFEAIKYLYSCYDVKYVLGYWCHIIPVEHCFLKYDGKYYDPTALLFKDNSQVRYFSLFELNYAELVSAQHYMKKKSKINDHITMYEWIRFEKENS